MGVKSGIFISDILLSNDGTFIEGKELREFPYKVLPPILQEWFDKTMKELGLKDIKCIYISNKGVKEIVHGFTHVGAFGMAYIHTTNREIAFIESDDGIDMDKKTIAHELLHYAIGGHDEVPSDVWDKAEKELLEKLGR
jgi:Zn-dependent peptidase ImmA (M78 family)